MSSADKALATQLRNIQTKTGKSLDELAAIVKSSGLTKHGEIRDMLKRLGFRLIGYYPADKVNSLGGRQTAHVFAVQKSDPAHPGFDRVNWL